MMITIQENYIIDCEHAHTQPPIGCIIFSFWHNVEKLN